MDHIRKAPSHSLTLSAILRRAVRNLRRRRFPMGFFGTSVAMETGSSDVCILESCVESSQGHLYVHIYIYICLCALHLRATCEMVADSCIQIIDFQRLLSNLVKRLAPISCHWFMIRNPFEIGGLFRRQQHARMSTSNFHTQASKKADTIFVYLALTKRWVTIWFHSPLIWKKQKCEDGIARHVSASVEPQATISHEIHKQIRHDFTTFTFPSFPPSLSSHDCIPIFFFSKILVDHGRHSIKAHTINMKLVYPVMSCTLVSAVYT